MQTSESSITPTTQTVKILISPIFKFQPNPQPNSTPHLSKMVKIEIKSREFIKPSTPTPLTLKTFNLSLLDQLSPPAYVPMIFYYINPNPKTTTTTVSRINNLKQSLSTALTGFYPLAGRVRDNLFIDCNDEGVEFLEARVDCPISDILKQPQIPHLDMFLPYDYHLSESKYSNIDDRAQLAVQANVFTCGGMAVGVCVLHKIVDGVTFTTLMSNWAALAKGGTRVSHDPLFVGPSLFPPRDLTGMFPAFDIPKAKCRTKRFVFDTSKIASLRSTVMTSGSLDHNPSRVEVLSALIWKCATNISKSKSKSVLTQAVNLRGRTDPPLPGHASGNLLWLSVASSSTSNGSSNIHELINHIQRSLAKFDQEHVKKMQGEHGFAVLCETLRELGDMMASDVDIYRFTSLGKFELYGIDFGWGRPVWVSSAGLEFKNVVVLMETRVGDGVEAWVTLEEEDMVVFEKNEELLSFVWSGVCDSVLSLSSKL